MARKPSKPPSLQSLDGAARSEIDIAWRSAFDAPPPPISSDLLVRAILYRWQEAELGGLASRVLTQLKRPRVETLERQKAKAATPRVGAVLVRTWQGRTYVVTVEADGFSMEGRMYESLSRLATEITGTKWSGPRFFGLTAGQEALRG